MAFTFDPTTERGQVRLLIQDDTETYDGEDIYFFTDEKIDAFLTLAADCEGLPVFNAAAMALESWASNQLMILKVVTRLDVAVDGAAVAREMRMRAGILRTQAVDASTDVGFDIAEMALGLFSEREQTVNEAIRDE